MVVVVRLLRLELITYDTLFNLLLHASRLQSNSALRYVDNNLGFVLSIVSDLQIKGLMFQNKPCCGVCTQIQRL
jgi:hypothetical protein